MEYSNITSSSISFYVTGVPEHWGEVRILRLFMSFGIVVVWHMHRNDVSWRPLGTLEVTYATERAAARCYRGLNQQRVEPDWHWRWWLDWNRRVTDLQDGIQRNRLEGKSNGIRPGARFSLAGSVRDIMGTDPRLNQPWMSKGAVRETDLCNYMFPLSEEQFIRDLRDWTDDRNKIIVRRT